MTDNPFYQRGSERLLQRGYRGGQHVASIGDSCRHKPPLPFERLLRAQDEGELPRELEPEPRGTVLTAFALATSQNRGQRIRKSPAKH
jgi:hypothetical protein